MRLQSAIFCMDDTLLEKNGEAREGLDKVLAIFKMESVWMYAVSADKQGIAQGKLEKAGLAQYFRGVLTSEVALCPYDSETMFYRAMKRLHAGKEDTVVFCAHLNEINGAKEAGFRTVAVSGGAEAAEWEQMIKEATETLSAYQEFLA